MNLNFIPYHLNLIFLIKDMNNPGEAYTKEISTTYTKTPDKVQFNYQEFIVEKTWKIG